jgi:hypothetical protein
MRMKKIVSVVVLACGLFAPLTADATTIGYYLSFTTGSPAGAITASGNTPQQLTNLTPADLAGISVLWILNGNNGTPDANVIGNVAAISSFVAAGGVLSFHDRNVNQGLSAATYIPGAAAVNFVNQFGANIDVLVNNGVTNGPAGVITNTTLDGGNFSDHGFATLGSLPAGAVGVLNVGGDTTHIVDFHYSFGAGDVYYSTIPLDFYLGGSGNNPPADAFRNIYAVNEAAFQASLAGPAAVPEPGTLLLVAVGTGLLALRRRRAA